MNTIDKVIRGVITLALVGASIYIWTNGETPPAGLITFAGIAMGQYLPKPGMIGSK